MLKRRAALAALLLVALVACGDDDSSTDPTSDSGTDPTSGDTDGDTGDNDTAGDTDTAGDGDGDGDETPSASQVPPTNGAELRPWLAAESYLEWDSESAIHPSTGPHFGDVLTYLNDAAIASLEAGNTVHPVGTALVKELYGRNDTLGGYAVMVKVAEGEGGDTWYWYEDFNGSVFADEVGDRTCTGCHGGSTRDNILTPFPLQ